MIPVFTNLAKSTLAANITNSATSITVATGGGALFPVVGASQYFMVKVYYSNDPDTCEFMTVTARSGDLLTVTRAQENTTASSWTTNAVVSHVNTAGIMTALAAIMPTSRTVSAATDALATDGVILANTDAGAFAITIPRALGQVGATKTLAICKTGATQIPLILQDDLGSPLPLTLVNGGTAFAFVVVVGGIVFAFGAQ